MGATEVVVLLFLSLSSVSVKQNPAAPSGDELSRYAVPGADFTVHLDVEAVLPGSYAALTNAASAPPIGNDPNLKAAAKKLLEQAEQGRGMARAFLGFDPVDDIDSATAWVSFPISGKGDPSVVVVVRGKLPADLLDRIPPGAGAPATVDGKKLIVLDGKMAVALVDPATALFGNEGLVRDRLKKSWKAPAKKGGAVRTAQLLDAKPFFLFASSPSPAMMKMAQKELADPDAALALDLVTGHTYAAVWMSHDGVGWTWTGKDAKGLERVVGASEGVIEMLRAGHHFTRGSARLALAAAESYAPKVPEVKMIVKYKKELIAMVDGLSGDGNFKADVQTNVKDRTVTVRATGKRLADVLPAGGCLPVGAIAAWFMILERSPSASPAMQAPNPMAKPPVKKK